MPVWLIVALTLGTTVYEQRRAPVDRASTRVAILVAEDRRAPTARDLAVLRAGARSADPETARLAVRALGRLERPDVIADILPSLKSPLPEVRAEAANALGQAAQGWKATAARTPAVRSAAGARVAPSATAPDIIVTPVIARLHAEPEASVRGALCQTLGRLPYTTPDQVARAEAALVDTLSRDTSVEGRLGVAQGLEALIRLHRRLRPPSAGALERLNELALSTIVAVRGESARDGDARVRRVAFEALTAADAISDALVVRGLVDRDAQVRRLAAKAMNGRQLGDPAYAALEKAITDESPMVRLEALRVVWPASTGHDSCADLRRATGDPDAHVALAAIDLLRTCRTPDTGALLERMVDDLSGAGVPRGWHRGAHAIVALAAVAPERAMTALAQFTGSRIWWLRLYAVRAAAVLQSRSTLEALAADPDDNVCEAALAALSRLVGHDADALSVAALDRQGYQAIRAAALALAGTPEPAKAAPALERALARLVEEGRDNSHDARDAIEKALGRETARHGAQTSSITADDLRRLASARARIVIRDVGTFELTLVASQAPASVIRFATLAQAGYYNGLTIHRVVPNFVIQGGSPGANEYIGDAMFMRDEVGLWPHVRGAVGVSTRGRDTGDAQIFIDLVDNPRLDHDYTVFAHVLNGMDVVDRILEGDVIERVEILL